MQPSYFTAASTTTQCRDECWRAQPAANDDCCGADVGAGAGAGADIQSDDCSCARVCICVCGSNSCALGQRVGDGAASRLHAFHASPVRCSMRALNA